MGLRRTATLIFQRKMSTTKEPTFRKVLVANRGEIACRIIRTARKMGIKTVAVYSVADAQAKHVKMADESIFIGPSPAIESYLNMEKIMTAIKETDSDAVHPGYGFLSENPDFVKLVESNNITFIGPPAEIISKMGDKLESKRTALAAGLSVIPGYNQIVKTVEDCVKIAKKIGYPVMIKASAGGGGKGMRTARNDQELREGYLLSTQEAQSSFGDMRMLVEKYIENPRHIEMQVLGDRHGNVVHLNERECSIQRRNQKVIEEAPSTFLDDTTRHLMGTQSVQLCKKIGYYSAGTVEFLVDQNRHFFFLEMNTRLQVEHPVTEFITGVDLVEQMFRIAKGHKLNIAQKDVRINGWAIESRVYAEDPYQSFGLPSIGRLYKYKEPHHLPGVRCDSGIEEGSKISRHYDPLICKLVCYGSSRSDAITKSKEALDSYVIRGIQHNIPLLRDILSQKSFCDGDISTNFLSDIYPDGFRGLKLKDQEKMELVAAAACLFAWQQIRNRTYNNIDVKRRKTDRWSLFVRLHDDKIYVDVQSQEPRQFVTHIECRKYKIDLSDVPIITINNKKTMLQVANHNASDFDLIFKGNEYKLRILSKKASEYLKLMPKKVNGTKLNQIRAPMSGSVTGLFCSEGDMVKEGQELLVIEAMKMQNLVMTQSTGRVKSIYTKVNDTVTNGDILVELDI